MADRFHNPYNFIPAPPRTKAAGTELGDRLPTPHDRYAEDQWSGKITVTLTTETPLLIPDAARATGSEHKTYPLRVVNGKPYLAPTSLKGMLRSAYEMITNSRLSVFGNHQERLAFRAPADAKNIYPAIVARRKNGTKILRILEAKEVFARVGRLPRYKKKPQSHERDKGESRVSLTYHNSDDLPMHGDRVWVRLNPSNQYFQDLPRAISQNLSRKPMPNLVTRICPRELNAQPPGAGDWHKGWVCITGANINGKVYERVFIETPGDPTVELTSDHESLWQELITNYQKEHQRDIEERQQQGLTAQDYLGDDPGETGYSRHVYQSGAEKLKLGSLCYVELQADCDLENLHPKDVVALLPVTISRRLYATSPQSLLDDSLKPADTIEKLSPADRVFGWVNSNGQGSYRGNLRIYGVQCLNENAIESFDQGLTLAILGQPKAQQARFYLAKDGNGEALAKGTPKEKGYQPNQGLRGRKIYPHQNVPNDYWNIETTAAIDGFHREYRQVNGEKTTQNRTIEAWVKPKSQFQFEIEVTNLSSIELGALLWLLTLPDGQFHRLGGGKPFGFGSVRLEIAQVQIQTGEQWKNSYRSLAQAPSFPELQEVESLIELFKAEIKKAYGKSFQEVSFVAAFSKASQGFAQPVHYPRLDKAPHPEGKSFEWFVCNEQGDKKKKGAKLALSDLIRDQGLPYSPVE
ncbi:MULTISPECIES: TIGR03986 family type III CRISPR-associated RAMP protein [Leptolyngbya]|uniref:TIGR03986 family type III CRISPR-associated RAMP protein n=1 Tax=Leptolyngbya TaxID=47251 RepID=UPI001686B418|nr:TIGR03986 family CRISPR-associated RAMP protein [Leptolyngbya sp. FACHB-1624]MBD1858241.1 TIGR03986 family CRISPR-associated RAMP protein [Leptolyngbya sp. FACHB-1624]